MNYLTLQTRVQEYLLDLPTETEALVGTWVNKAIEMAARRYNFRFMATTHEVSTVDNTRKLDDKPAAWKEAGAAPWLLHQDGGSSEINWAPSPSAMVRLFGAAAPAEGNAAAIDEGEPQYILETDTELEVWPFPDDQSTWDDGNYRVRVPYWAMPDDLSADGDTNWLTNNASFYIIYYAAAEGHLFNQDEARAGGYQQMAEMEFKRVVNKEKRSYIPDRMTLAIHRGVHGAGRNRRI